MAKECGWQQNPDCDDEWFTDCGKEWVMFEGCTPTDSDMTFCPFCGRKLAQRKDGGEQRNWMWA